MEDISIYKNTKRNDKCPCDSGKIFKKCCMNEYREAKKKKSNVAISTYSPLDSLSKDEQKFFTEFYTNLMIFSNQHKSGLEAVVIDDKNQNMQSFIHKERIYFYENSDEIIEEYIKKNNPDDEELLILDALKEVKFEEFFLLAKSDENAVIMDKKENLYNIKALNSPFTEIFNQKLKYMGIKTALIPYKNRYITDGIYGGFELDKEIENYFDQLPYRNPPIIYNKTKDTRNYEFSINFSIGCDVDRFEEMEEIILKKIPDDFTKGMLKLFENQYSHKENLISSFIRTNDFLELLEDKKGHQTLSYIFGGLPVTHYEQGNKDGSIRYELLEHYYKQVPIEESISYKAYKNAFDINSNRGLFDNKMAFTSFYNMLGISYLSGDENIEKFGEFLNTFKQEKQRKKLTIGLENLFNVLSKKAGFEIYPIFLDVCIDLNDIEKDMEQYLNYSKDLDIPSLDNLKKYSINKGKSEY